MNRWAASCPRKAKAGDKVKRRIDASTGKVIGMDGTGSDRLLVSDALLFTGDCP